MVQPEFITGFGGLVDRFEGFILDQWGVLHNGSTPYDGAIELIEELRRRGKRLVVLSNSGRRAAENATQLQAIGFNPSAFDAIVTSGEVCWQALANKDGSLLGPLGKRCLLLARTGDLVPVAGLDLELVDDPETADFVYLSWAEQTPERLLQRDRLLKIGPARDLVMVCANPDRVAPVAGGLIEAPGTFAARYAGAGGRVAFVGKPYRPIYTAMLNAFEGFELDELVCVGDSLEHDIQGANGMDLASCLIAGGIHEDDVGADLPMARRLQALDRLMVDHNAHPNFIAPNFSF